MKQPIFELYDLTNDQTIKIYDNGKVEYSDKDMMYTCVTNHIQEKEIEVHNEAIEACLNEARTSWNVADYVEKIRKLKK